MNPQTENGGVGNDADGCFLWLFFSRLDTYGRQTSPTDAVTEKRPVSPDLMQLHFDGLVRIGAHSTNPDNYCRYGCIDLDHDEADLTEPERDQLFALGPQLVRKGRELGLRLWLETSKSGAWHVWLFPAEPVLAHELRLVLRYLLAECGLPFRKQAKQGGPKNRVEMFPGQDDVRGEYGNWVYLPYFDNGAHGRSVMLDVQADGALVPLSLADFCDQVETVSLDRLHELAEQQEARDGQQGKRQTTGAKETENGTAHTVMRSLAAHCWRFRGALTIQQGEGLTEPEWFNWVHTLTVGGHADAAREFSVRSTKHDGRSVSRIAKIAQAVTEGTAAGPIHCTTFGCTEQEISACFGGVVYRKDGEISNTPLLHLRETGVGGNGAHAAAELEPEPPATEPPWPELAEEARHGLAGDIVRAIDPYTEADPVAVLLNVLAAFGNCINSAAHARVQHDHHPARLFVVQVGETSKGRKGTGWSTPRYLFSLCDPDWAKQRVKSGLSSGEGLIYNVRDPRYQKVPVKEKGRFTGEYDEVCVDEGESDKRLLVIEAEFAATLTVMAREGNILSAIIRQAWDSGDLSPLTKNNPTVATNAHISILAHVTKQELLARLDDTSKANGFANRFLWALVRRSKELPEGGAVPDDVLQPLAERLEEVITFSRTTSEIKRDNEAGELWHAVYHDLSAGKPGLLGAVLSRAEAQVLRLSVIYTLLDMSSVVRVEHLRAALAVWEYCERSAVLIFGNRLGDPTADRILEALRNAGPKGMTESDIYELFGKHKSANERARALNLLASLGLVRSETEETRGRPRTLWKAA